MLPYERLEVTSTSHSSQATLLLRGQWCSRRSSAVCWKPAPHPSHSPPPTSSTAQRILTHSQQSHFRLSGSLLTCLGSVWAESLKKQIKAPIFLMVRPTLHASQTHTKFGSHSFSLPFPYPKEKGKAPFTHLKQQQNHGCYLTS